MLMMKIQLMVKYILMPITKLLRVVLTQMSLLLEDTSTDMREEMVFGR